MSFRPLFGLAVAMTAFPFIVATAHPSHVLQWTPPTKEQPLWQARYRSLCDAILALRSDLSPLDRPGLDEIYAASHCPDLGAAYSPASQKECHRILDVLEDEATAVADWYPLAATYTQNCRGR